MLLALLALLPVCSSARNFNITDLFIPEVVGPGQTDVVIECRYDADFTLLSWFKGPTEFFRYRPRSAPSTRSFSVLGVGKIDVIICGPAVCKLRLAYLTEEATGLYRCDIEREDPPYMFETRKGHMTVRGVEHRRPLLEGVVDQYGEKEQIEAYCRGVNGSEMRWYINGRELFNNRGSPSLNKTSSRLMFMGVPPTMSLQCAEFRGDLLLGSKEVKAKWKHSPRHVDKAPQEQRNTGSHNNNKTIECILVILGITKLVSML